MALEKSVVVKLNILLMMVGWSVEFSDIASATCPQRIFGEGENFYVLSDYQNTANNVRSICNNFGGEQVRLRDDVMHPFLKVIQARLLHPELVSIDIYENPTTEDNFKFRPSNNKFEDVETIHGWKRPQVGRLKSFKLYSSARGKSFNSTFTQEVFFCFVAGRDRLQAYICNASHLGWNPNFVAFGGDESAQTSNVILLFSYDNNLPHLLSSNLFLRNDIDEAHLQYAWAFYIQDISLFIGARSDVGQSDWFWNNGTMINNLVFRPSNPSVCQEMTWPFTYDDGINLRPKNCAKDSAYFICQIRFQLEVRPVMCHGTKLQVSWKPSSFEDITREKNALFVQLEIEGLKSRVKLPFFKAFHVFSNLEQNTNYTVEAQIQQCDLTNLKVSASAKTFYGIPNPVINAKFVEIAILMSDCVIEWEYDKIGIDVLSYRLHVMTSTDVQIFHLDINSITLLESTSIARYEFNLTTYGVTDARNMSFQLQATTCEGESEIRNVSGFCNSSIAQTDDVVNIVINIAATVGGAAFMTIMFFLIRCKRGTRKQSDAQKEKKKKEEITKTKHCANDPDEDDYVMANPVVFNAIKLKQNNKKKIIEVEPMTSSIGDHTNKINATFEKNDLYRNKTNDVNKEYDDRIYEAVN